MWKLMVKEAQNIMPKIEIYQSKYRKFIVEAENYDHARELDLTQLNPSWESDWETEDMQEVDDNDDNLQTLHPKV